MTSKPNYTAVKQWRQDQTNALMEKCHVFWAFSIDQLNEGKAKNPLRENEKYCDIGAGGFMPTGYHKELKDGLVSIEKEYKAKMKEVKAEQAILYELNNHEAFYTGEIDNTVDALEGLYTVEQIKEVYKNNRNRAEYVDAGFAIN